MVRVHRLIGQCVFTPVARSVSARLLVNAFTNERGVNRIGHDRGEAHAGVSFEFADPSSYSLSAEKVVVITEFVLFFLSLSR